MKRSIIFSVLALFLTAAACLAQTTLGIIAGTVTDNSGAALAGATVTVQRSDGGEAKVVKPARLVTTGSSR